MRIKLEGILVRIAMFFALCLSSLSVTMGQTYQVEDVPNVVLADSLRLTSDPAGLLDTMGREELDRKLAKLRQKYGIEIAIVVLPSIGEQDIEEFANRLFRAWGIGHKEDNSGLLILVIKDRKRLRFEVGYGLEGILTDAMCAQIQRRSILPLFKRGAYTEGLIAGIEDVDSVLSAEWTKLPKNRGERDRIDTTALILCYLIFVGIAFIWFMGEQRRVFRCATTPHTARQLLPQLEDSYRNALWGFLVLCLPIALVIYFSKLYYMRQLVALAQRCDHCSEHTMALAQEHERASYLCSGDIAEELVGSSTHRVYLCPRCSHVDVIKDTNPHSQATLCPNCGFRTFMSKRPYRIGQRLVRLERYCVHCNHQDKKDHRVTDDLDTNDMLSSIILSGLWGAARSSGRGFGGGGFSGGSFGGGSSGGGGATSSW